MTKNSMNDDAPAAEADAAPSGPGKSGPTPKRSTQVAQNRRPLVPDDRKEAKQRARSQMAEARERARIGMANGEEKYLPERDRGHQKRYVRDWVDARTTIGEFLLPFMFVVIIATFIPVSEIQVYGMLILWVFFIVMIVEGLINGRIIRKRLGERFGESKVERGVRWYAFMRTIQLRRLRLPKPQVKRGQYPS